MNDKPIDSKQNMFSVKKHELAEIKRCMLSLAINTVTVDELMASTKYPGTKSTICTKGKKLLSSLPFKKLTILYLYY